MEQFRQDFPVFKHLVYINSCSYGALAEPVATALQRYLSDRIEYGERWPYWVELMETLRTKTADLLGVASEEISLQASLSSGLNALVTALDFTSGRRKVVCTEFDFPTTAQIWHAQKRRGAEICSVALDHSETPEADICAAIDERTAVVCVPYVCYRHGRRLDIAPIAAAARRHGALMIVDAYQAIGAFPVSPRDLDVDVMLGGYLKYLLGTAGMAFMYVRADLSARLQPTTSGWFAQEDVGAMSIADHVPASTARKFEGGTPNVSAAYACVAGLDYLQQVGLGAIDRHVTGLTGLLKDTAKARGWQLATGEHDHGAMLAIRTRDMYGLVTRLRESDIVVSCRDDNLRVSPHFYNSASDIERLCDALQENSKLLY